MFRRHNRAACTVAILLLVLGALPSLAAEPTLAGHWEGSISLPSQKLAVDLDFKPGEGGAWTGDISIPAQNAKDLPLINITAEDAAVSFEIQGVPGTPTFKGSLSADGGKIAGDFTQGGATLPFELSRGAAPAEAAREALAGYDEFVAKAIQDWEVPGLAVAIVKGGEVVYAQGFGQSDVEHGKPVTPDTLFAIGSSSKAFTTFVVGTLVDEGKLDWDKPVTTFLPGFQLHDPNTTALITPRDLVTHRSGLPRHDLVWYNNFTDSRENVVSRLRFLEPNEQLRAKFQYNNLMYLTAGYLVEHVTGKSWEDNVRERVFVPLGMTNSNFSVLESQKSADFALPYRERDDKIEKIPFRDITMVGPAGSINSSVNDMAKWVKLHLGSGKVGDRQVLGAATLADLHTPRMPIGAPPERPEILPVGYALGWFVDVYRGHRRVHHGGNIDGFSALVSLLPDDDLGIVVLTNKDGTALPGLLVRHTVDRLLKLEPIDWNGEALAKREQTEAAAEEAEKKKDVLRKAGTKPAHKLAEYAGDYEHPGYGTLTVAVKGSALEMTYNGITAPLEHWHYEVWNGAKGGADPTFEDGKLLFQGDMRGNVAAVAAQFEPQVADIVFTRKPDARLFDPAWLARFVGDYELPGPQLVTIALSGTTLTVNIPGQPQLHLVPGLGGEFTLREFSVISLAFVEDAQGNVTGVNFNQPNGVFFATRK